MSPANQTPSIFEIAARSSRSLVPPPVSNDENHLSSTTNSAPTSNLLSVTGPAPSSPSGRPLRSCRLSPARPPPGFVAQSPDSRVTMRPTASTSGSTRPADHHQDQNDDSNASSSPSEEVSSDNSPGPTRQIRKIPTSPRPPVKKKRSSIGAAVKAKGSRFLVVPSKVTKSRAAPPKKRKRVDEGPVCESPAVACYQRLTRQYAPLHSAN